jgi:spore germination cell wall hydrolase CwlJ-like protein
MLLTFDGTMISTSCSEVPKVSYSKPVNVEQKHEEKQVQCLADTAFFEAAGEPLKSKEAVAMVVMNRVSSGKFPESVCGVVNQKVNGAVQFSWVRMSHKKQLQRKHLYNEAYTESREVAHEVYHNFKQLKDHTKGATYYHAKYVKKKALGIRKLQLVAKIGQHVFYSL